jgi:hypothetical protein
MHNKANGHETMPLLIPSGLKRERMSLRKKDLGFGHKKRVEISIPTL